MKYINISNKIIALKNKDLKLRELLIKKNKLNNDYNKEMEKLHNNNAFILNDIITTIGYPTIEKVGKEANEAAWLIVQHSISQPSFMKKYLQLLKKEVHKNNENAIKLAYLTDRIAVFEGKIQLYGTQFDWDETMKLSPYPFDCIKKVNERRKKIQLNTLEEQIEIIRARAKTENQLPPKNFGNKKLEYNKWRKKVGWTN